MIEVPTNAPICVDLRRGRRRSVLEGRRGGVWLATWRGLSRGLLGVPPRCRRRYKDNRRVTRKRCSPVHSLSSTRSLLIQIMSQPPLDGSLAANDHDHDHDHNELYL